ncbi:MAG: hypothetical protein WAO91_08435 [Candidatus Nitrosotenuis sp.]
MQIKPTTLLLIVGIIGIGLLSINTLDVFSVDKKNLATGFNEEASAQAVFLTIKDTNSYKEFTFNTFSRIGVVRSDTPQFLVESIPSAENKEFLKFVAQSVHESQGNRVNPNKNFFDVTLEVLAKDGSVIETIQYKRCTIESYFVYINDSKGTYSLLGRDSARAEIRDVTKFDCTYLTIEV